MRCVAIRLSNSRKPLGLQLPRLKWPKTKKVRLLFTLGLVRRHQLQFLSLWREESIVRDVILRYAGALLGSAVTLYVQRNAL